MLLKFDFFPRFPFPIEKRLTIYRLCLLAFFISACDFISIIAAETLFIANVGAKNLPIVYIYMALISIGLMTFLTRIINKYKRSKIFLYHFSISIIILTFVFLLTKIRLPAVYYIAYIVLEVSMIVQLITFHTFIRDYLSTLEIRRTLNLIALSFSVGGITGSFIAKSLSAYIDANYIILILILLYFLGLNLISYIDKTSHLIDASEEENNESLSEALSVIYQVIKKYTFVRILCLSYLLANILYTVGTFCVFSIYEKYFETEADLMNFLGIIHSIFCVLELIISLFIIGFLINKTLPTTKNIIYPFINLLGFTGMIFFPILPLAIFSHSTFSPLWDALNEPINSQNFNAVPQRYIGNVRLITEGLIFPLALAGTSLFLLLLQKTTSSSFEITVYFGAFFSIIFLFINYKLGSIYVSTIIHQLKDKLFVLNPETQALPQLQKDHLKFVIDMLRSTDREQQQIALSLASSINPLDIFTELEQILKQDQPETSLLILEILKKSKTKQLQSRLVGWLEGNNLLLKKIALEALIIHQFPFSESTLEKLYEISSEDFQTLVTIALVMRSEDSAYPAFLKDQNPYMKITQNPTFALSILKDIADQRLIPLLKDLSRTEIASIKEQSLLILAKIASPLDNDLLMILSDNLEDKDEAIRVASLQLLGALCQEQYIFLISKAFSDPSLKVRLCAAQQLARFQDKALPIASHYLFAPYNLNTTEASFEMIGHIRTIEAENLLKSYLRKIYMQATLNQHWMMHISSSDLDWQPFIIAIVNSNQRIIECIFHVFSALGHTKYIPIIQKAILTQDNTLRDDALESLSSLPHSDLVAPLEQIISYLSNPSQNALSNQDNFSYDLSLNTIFLNEALLSYDPWIQLGALTVMIDKGIKIPEATFPTLFPLAKETLALASIPGIQKKDLLMNRLLFLKNIPLFQGLGLDELLSIESHFIRQNFVSGEVVFRQGDIGTDFYIIYQGNVDIKIHKNNHDVIVANLGEGEYFGEIALFDNQPRTATVVAHNDCVLLRLSQKIFLNLARQRPEILLNICRVLSQRLRDVEKKT